MKLVNLEDIFDLDKLVDEVVEVLRNDGIVLMPSDTCYGFVADSGSVNGRLSLAEIKQMPLEKPISMCAADKKMFVDCLDLDLVTGELIEEYLPGRLTIVAPGNQNCSLELNSKNMEHLQIMNGDFVGIRLPEHTLMTKVSSKLGRPIFTTSANIHGRPSCYSVEEFKDQIGLEGFAKIDMVIDAGVLDENAPSSVIKVDDNRIEILRGGEIADSLVGRYQISS